MLVAWSLVGYDVRVPAEDALMRSSFEELADELAALFARGVDTPLGDVEFDTWARRVFQFQFEAVAAYRGLCERRGVTPATLSHWSEIPGVPTRAFKALQLVSGSFEDCEAVFQTSGTTRGAETRGTHCVRRLELYRASALPNLRAHLLAGLDEPVTILALLPPPRLAPHSSLSHMTAMTIDAWGSPQCAWFADPERGLDFEALGEALQRSERQRRPVCVVGTAFAFVHWLDAVAAGSAPRVGLPEGSRLMETGGFKGRSREVPRAELYGGLCAAFGVSLQHIVNEYGMTEMLSQFWEPVLHHPHTVPLERRVHRLPPWVRTRVLDPETLHPVSLGTQGLLSHFDLANLGSVSAILTEDLGVEADEGFRVLGRAPGAEPRGCSLTMEELLR